MESLVSNIITNASLPVLFMIIAVTLYTLSKGADLLVDEAVALSEELGIPKMIIGATIVSLGTTLPEASVSVMASIAGNSSLALGNAVGSVICDTGLILGIAALISPLKIQKDVVNRHGWIQFSAGLLLVLVSIPFTSLRHIFTRGGHISNLSGVLFIILLGVYIYTSIKWTKNSKDENLSTEESNGETGNKFITLMKLVLGVVIIIISSKILIPTVQETAIRLNVPNSVIAATLVAFGTSLPELVTSVTASIKGHGELAIGNVIGADILNVLFVVGSAAAFSKEGIHVTPDFFKLYFPAMIFVLTVFRLSTIFSKDKLKRSSGFILLLTYIVISVLSYL
ncbi:sodium:calcium antiporter [Caloranaerobacter azorensis H53214]|uniref:Sodium:calcium antiporter n=1 Tax=Caloranaerobacter azorensis H53214 TaxID=1156417 RepID=A0A096DNR5_9FIRM|nr:calcium/sodium antiporter [Caloranaerobacter azorensis]KGG80906.1 sodium:calcium antiporter [Caloranaerobacter azorensis H53214]